jgi:hypothetical protein
MVEGVERRHEEIPGRHPRASLSLGSILTFVGGRVRRGPRTAGQVAEAAAEREPLADRRGSIRCSRPRASGRSAT